MPAADVVEVPQADEHDAQHDRQLREDRHHLGRHDVDLADREDRRVGDAFDVLRFFAEQRLGRDVWQQVDQREAGTVGLERAELASATTSRFCSWSARCEPATSVAPGVPVTTLPIRNK